MTDRFSRRSLAAAGLLPAAAMTRPAHAEGANESTFDRVQRTRTLRIAALPGELPWFSKDLATGEWSGAAISMAKDIARVFDAQLTYVESTYGNSVLDLQSNKVDLAFALNPTPQRAVGPLHAPDHYSPFRLRGAQGTGAEDMGGHQQARPEGGR